MTDSQRSKCKKIIHTAATSAGAVGTGLAQLPMSDNLAIIPIQMTMIASLAFGITEAIGWKVANDFDKEQY